MYIDGNKFNQNCYDLMETITTHKIRLLFSIIQLCVNKIISQFSTLNPIPVFNPNLKILQSRSARTRLIKALFYFATKKSPRVKLCLPKKQKARKHDKSVKYDQFVNYLNEKTKPNPPPLAAI